MPRRLLSPKGPGRHTFPPNSQRWPGEGFYTSSETCPGEVAPFEAEEKLPIGNWQLVIGNF